MLIRLYHTNLCPYSGGLILPKHLRPGPPPFLWMRYRFQNDLWDIAHYNCDNALAASALEAGPVTPVSVTQERGPVMTIPVRRLKS